MHIFLQLLCDFAAIIGASPMESLECNWVKWAPKVLKWAQVGSHKKAMHHLSSAIAEMVDSPEDQLLNGNILCI